MLEISIQILPLKKQLIVLAATTHMVDGTKFDMLLVWLSQKLDLKILFGRVIPSYIAYRKIDVESGGYVVDE